MYFRSYPLLKAPLHKCLNSTVSKHPSTVNKLNGPKHLWNVHENTFITFPCHSEQKWLGKPLSCWYLNSYESFLKHWLPITSILFVIFEICSYYIKCSYLKKKVYFSIFLYIFESFINFWTFWKKDDIHSQCIFEIIDPQRHP